MPYLSDQGPPVDGPTLHAAREELPREYGLRVVNTTGRRTVLVRVPRAKPDYNYELARVAFYATLEDVKDAHDVLLVGDEKSVRLEPLRLRDHIREQRREDGEVVPALRRQLPRDFGWTVFQSPMNANHRALVLRLPIERIAEADEPTLLRARAAVGHQIVDVLRQTQYVYLIADQDFGRIGRRVFVEAVASDLAGAVALPDARTPSPLHLAYQTPGHFIQRT